MLPAPNLDDRGFQDLVDDAKRLVQQRCPTWTDHNVSDPGVTLIEAVAQMVDQLIYRLNRVPDRNYIKFLELIGVELRPPAAARGSATFWLAAPQPQPVVVRAESRVATPRTDVSDPVTFSTVSELTIVPCSFARAGIQPAKGTATDTTAAVGRGGFPAFSQQPAVGDALLIGLSDAVPSCAVLLRFDCTVSGRGVDPRNPPLVWEAWTDDGWAACDLGSDDTGGLNKPGDVILHVPDGHRASVITRERAGWLRCRLVAALPGQPSYVESPTILGVQAHTVGGTAPTIHAEVVHHEVIGRSDGTSAQRFALQRRPVVASETPLTLAVQTGDSVQQWTEVAHFAQSGPDDRHFRIDAFAGELEFGPALRTADGALRRYGDLPPAGAVLRLDSYRTGGGQAGNVARGQVRVLKTSIPYVSRVENREPAIGGADAETLADAKARGPLLLRSRGRAVTVADFEELARDAAPDAARVACVPESGVVGGVRLLVVPHVAGDDLGRIERTDLDPPWQILERISQSLDERRLVGTRLLVQPPDYVWLTAVVQLSARPRFDPGELRAEVLRALYRLYDPLCGGPDGTGWPFGRAVQAHEVHATLARIPGVDMAREVNVALYPAEADTGTRGAAVTRLDLPPTALVYSFDHQVRVVA
ncbi:MAG: putative baseplate assembly protein [Micropruina sp.]|uniref:putative baseplate assembly protein n=1 Tax=Micropruina sp. TaxID=2737536 RepID=UPI0039E723CB